MGKRRKIGVLSVPLAVVILSLGVALASAELTARGDLFVRFSGGIQPQNLPRHERAPIAVQIEGKIRTLSGARPPALRRMSIAINQGGKLDTRGLAICRRPQIEPSTSREARTRCGAALVGSGSYEAAVAFPEQSAFPSQGRILAFNTIHKGKRAVLAHIFSGKPVPITRLVMFEITETKGTFGTVLSGALPPTVNRWGYLKRISLRLFRTYAYQGKKHSYLSAACAAPPGFSGATFPFAKASMAFEDGRKLASVVTRSCGVRGAGSGPSGR